MKGKLLIFVLTLFVVIIPLTGAVAQVAETDAAGSDELTWGNSEQGRRQPRPRVGGQQGRRPQRTSRVNEPEMLRLTPEQEEETLAYVEKVQPDRVENLRRLKNRNPDNYWRFLSRAFREMRYLEDLKESDPERFERVSAERAIDRQVRDLARQYKNETDSAEKSSIEAEIKTLLDQQFEYRQTHRNEEIDRLEKKLAELKANNQERIDNKDEIIKRRLEELLGGNQVFKW